LLNKIGIKITKEKPVNLPRANKPLKHCSAVGLARTGERFYIQTNDISCPLARYNLGLQEPDNKFMHELARTLVGWGDAKSEDIGLKYLQTLPKLTYAKKYILYFPVPDNEYEPDVIIEISTPHDLMLRVRELTAITGASIEGYMSGVGAMCGECTAYPILTGKPNVSVGCTGSRPGAELKANELFLAIPEIRNSK
jgi:uncharacterized protein (DUF169 family)